MIDDDGNEINAAAYLAVMEEIRRIEKERLDEAMENINEIMTQQLTP